MQSLSEWMDDLMPIAREVYKDNPILQQVSITQAIHESALMRGGSKLATVYKNLFGIKGAGTKGVVNLRTQEEIAGNVKTLKDYFAVNYTYRDSFRQHYRLMNYRRYAPVRNATTIEEAFVQLYKCGYATDSKYSEKLQDIYNQYVRKLYESNA